MCLGIKNQFFTLLFLFSVNLCISEGYNRVLENFQKIVIFGQKCVFFFFVVVIFFFFLSKIRKFVFRLKLFFFHPAIEC